jgi:Papain family cysteine protease/Cathepsin propeptide inhibitor domain (I29)
MRGTTGLVFVCIIAAMSGYFVFSGMQKSTSFSRSDVEVFNRWRAEFNKLSATPSENDFRMRVLIGKAKQIREWNAQYEKHVAEKGLPPLTGPMFELNEWSDLTDEEFNKMYNGVKTDELEHLEVDQSLGYELPVSNTGLGVATYYHRVRSQGSCGSCWAFATVATLERHYFVRRGVQIDFSQQLLVDCTSVAYGCNGGWPPTALDYVKASGIQTGVSYPYTGTTNVCKRQAEKTIWFDSTFASKTIPYTTTAAINAVNKQITPVILVYASGKFGSLSKTDDIFDARFSGECDKVHDHDVNLVSVGRDTSNRSFLKMQNSWGTGWGYQGSKKVYPCSETKLWGAPDYIIHSTNVSL